MLITVDHAGNRSASAHDYCDVDCSSYREALSAQLDGERPPLPDDQVSEHLAGCQDCASWLRRAESLRKTMTVVPAPRVPDLTGSIMAGARVPKPWLGKSVRIALGVVAVVQLGMTLAQLFGFATGMGGHAGHAGSMTTHLSHESAAWNIAVGIGLLFAAVRPRSVIGQLPVLTGFVIALTTLSVIDILGGNVTIDRLLTHGFVVLGLVLLCVLRRTERDSLPGPVRPAAEPEWTSPARTEPPAPVPAREEPPRPASKQRAA